MVESLHSANFLLALETEKSTLRAFIEILKKEENALIQGIIEEIDHLASDKSHLVERLLKLDEHRNEHFYNQGLPPGRNCVSTWLKQQYPNQPEIQIAWNELLELARIAQKFNQSNGLVISAYLQHNQQAFAALQCATGNISLYNPKGQAYFSAQT
ncbi:flagella synthesis protein FlgN [Nitrosomonas sp. Nm166]|uniref:flagella synthesis protein FlgN n=1 Tax=Nitrosomonas sp. Nm166 TaxID=1881054 RepID=UPI0008EDA0F8|nr:flagellar protein FlgN [Nitrosomonas sp. Nm166]SFE52405.1 flagella synthesis protein FlgN [Nitrosomonas sp. Nm166]